MQNSEHIQQLLKLKTKFENELKGKKEEEAPGDQFEHQERNVQEEDEDFNEGVAANSIRILSKNSGYNALKQVKGRFYHESQDQKF